MTKGIALATTTDTHSHERLLIVGFGDIGARVARLLRQSLPLFRDWPISALIRDVRRVAEVTNMGVEPVMGDLNDPSSLQKIGAIAPTRLMHFAPPPSDGTTDTHTQHLLGALDASPPRQLIYISTTGVYGDCQGEWIDESAPLVPLTARAVRRVDAEHHLQTWCTARGVQLVVLRAPGIYAEDRLPTARIQSGTPALRAEDDVYSNHIHADDLTLACVAALAYARSGVFNVVDDEPMRMADYFDLVADHFQLTRPPRITRAEAAQQIAAPLLSFMGESRRICNAAVRTELHWAPRYPSVAAFLQTLRNGS
jgi:nucleoside-diphosphate-sugar epimerase